MAPFDCELIRSGFPAQPANAISALAFVAAAGWLWRRGRRGPSLFVAAAGLGSFWFHADPSTAASWAHDATLYALLTAAAVEAFRATTAHRPPIVAAGILSAGLVVWFFSRTDGALCNPESILQGHALWHLLAAVATVVLFSSGVVRPVRAK